MRQSSKKSSLNSQIDNTLGMLLFNQIISQHFHSEHWHAILIH